jgi:hypothetical protein
MPNAITAANISVVSIAPVNPKRGKHKEVAIEFVQRFPVGSTLAIEEFDQWAWDHGHLPNPGTTVKSSDEWLAHLQRRHQFRHRINMAGAHPQLAALGSTPFIMDNLGNGKYEVREPHIAIATNRIDPRLESARKKVVYLMQSADWRRLSDLDRKFAEEIYYEVDEYRDEVVRKAAALNAKFRRFEAFLRSRVEQGLVISPSGGIQQLLEDNSEADDEE